MAQRILLTGGTGMLGTALQRLCPRDLHLISPSRTELNLLDRAAVHDYLQTHKFDGIIHTAAKVGGIKANMNDQAAFLSENILISTHIIEEARSTGINKLINLGSSCMYPRNYRMPLVETDILAALPEPTNEGYAIAKIAAAKLCAYTSAQYSVSYKTLIPCNLYGPHDHFNLDRGHLVAAALLKVHQAKIKQSPTVEIWGDGTARREFLYIDDLARFILHSLNRIQEFPAMMNVGSGIDHTINEYYNCVREAVGYTGIFTHKLDAPVGMTQKLMNSGLATRLGWSPTTTLKAGLQATYDSFSKEYNLCGVAAAE